MNVVECFYNKQRYILQYSIPYIAEQIIEISPNYISQRKHK